MPDLAIPPMRSAAFLDRDGVLNLDVGFAHRADQIQWVEGAAEAIARLNRKNMFVFVVTNQSGVARGLYTEDDVRRLHEWMTTELHARGAHIDAFAYCPHFPEGDVAAYRKVCACRKPAPGMLLNLMKNWPVQRETSFMIGDRETDIAAARAAGLQGYLFPGGNLLSFMTETLGL